MDQRTGAALAARGAWIAATLAIPAAIVALGANHLALLHLAAEPFRPASAVDGLALRLVLLGLPLFAWTEAPGRRAAAAAAVVGALFCASIAWSGAVSALWVASALATAWAERAGAAPKLDARTALALAGTLALSAAAIAGSHKDAARAAPRAPEYVTAAEETTRWLERENLFQAQHWARRWAAEERAGGEAGPGTLVLARIKRKLGHEEDAKRLLEKVARAAKSDELRESARRELAGGGP